MCRHMVSLECPIWISPLGDNKGLSYLIKWKASGRHPKTISNKNNGQAAKEPGKIATFSTTTSLCTSLSTMNASHIVPLACFQKTKTESCSGMWQCAKLWWSCWIQKSLGLPTPRCSWNSLITHPLWELLYSNHCATSLDPKVWSKYFYSFQCASFQTRMSKQDIWWEHNHRRQVDWDEPVLILKSGDHFRELVSKNRPEPRWMNGKTRDIIRKVGFGEGVFEVATKKCSYVSRTV